MHDGREVVYDVREGGKSSWWEGGSESYHTLLSGGVAKNIYYSIFFYRKTIVLSDRSLNDEHENISL